MNARRHINTEKTTFTLYVVFKQEVDTTMKELGRVNSVKITSDRLEEVIVTDHS